MRGGLGSFLAGALSGYGTMMKFKREDEDAAARAEDRAFQKGQRERTTRLQDEQDQLQAGAATAAKPLALEEQTAQDVYATPAAAQGFMVGGQRYADKGVAERAVEAGNTAEATNARVAGFYRSRGKVMEAGAMERDALQTKAAGLQVKAAEGAQADQNGLKQAVQLVAAGDAAGIARWYNENYNDGQTADVKLRPDGTFDVAVFDKGGKQIDGKTGVTGDQMVAAMGAKYDPKLYMAAEQRKQDKAAAAERQTVEDGYKDRTLKVAERNADSQALVRAAQAEAATARAEAARARAAGGGAGGGAAPGTAPVWDDKAAAFLRQRYTVADPVTGQVGVDGAGLQFGKAIAVSVAQTNGGDIDRAIGFAFEKDNELKAMAKGDPAAHNALRQQYLKIITTPPAAPGAAPAAPPSEPAKVPPQPRAATPAAVAAQGLPRPTRGGVGQGKAMLPWEKPEGTF